MFDLISLNRSVSQAKKRERRGTILAFIAILIIVLIVGIAERSDYQAELAQNGGQYAQD